MDWTKMHDRNTLSPATPLLAFLSFLYGLAVRLRVRAYGRMKRESLPGFVMSVGNLTVGGTGKTPAVLMIAEWARDEGYHVAVLSRGYGGRYREEVLEVSDGDQMKAGPAEAGDEPYLLAKRIQGAAVVLSRKRYLAGLYAHNRFGSNFFILDDGFQHVALKRDLDLVLLDASRPFGNSHLLPWGPLREPVAHLKRADAFILTGSDKAKDGIESGLSDFLRHKFPARPIFKAEHLPDKLFFLHKAESHGPECLKGKRILAFAGIARPERFRDTLKGLGAEVVAFRGFRDHHPFSSVEIRQLVSEKERINADFLVTTEKDWVRVEGLRVHEPELACVTIRFDLSEKESFFDMVKGKAQAKISA
jgi:tetraacyldisaccharide 4'-kinase